MDKFTEVLENCLETRASEFVEFDSAALGEEGVVVSSADEFLGVISLSVFFMFLVFSCTSRKCT